MIAKILILFLVSLSALAVLGGISPINEDGMRQRLDIRTLQASVHGLLLAESNYQFENNTSLPLNGWKAALRRDGLRIPIIKGFDITYAETAGKGRYFCFSSELGNHPDTRNTLTETLKKFVASDVYEVYFHDHCGATSSAPEADWSTLSDLNLTVYTGS